MQTFIAAVVAVQLLWTSPASGGPGAQIAQASPVGVPSGATARAAAEVAASEARRRSLRAEKAKLRATYNRQLQEIDRLKAQRRSWRRDRQLREQKAESQETALALGRVDARLRAEAKVLRARRSALVAAIDRELAGAPSAVRARELASLRAKVRRALRPPVRKISLPDDRLDELADPEELLEQIALIEEAERELAREQEALRRQAGRYERMAELRARRQRASDMTELDDDRVRRSTGRAGDDSRSTGGGGGAGAPASESDDAEAPSGGSDGFGGEPQTDPGSLIDTSIVLSDVVDTTTQDALRRADRSLDPGAKARATRRAHEQVGDRLERLRRSRQRIETHLRTLRRQER